MNEDLKGSSLADVLEKLEKGKIGHRAAMEWLNGRELRRSCGDHARQRSAHAGTSADACGPGNARARAPDIPPGRAA
jgi:hypothetical protein